MIRKLYLMACRIIAFFLGLLFRKRRQKMSEGVDYIYPLF